MFNLSKYSVEINIDLDNGVYVFEDESGIGKTRLYKLLNKYNAYGETVASYSYNDLQKNVSIETVLQQKYQVILLDRYDLYNGEGSEIIKKLQEDCIILIDCKNVLKIPGVNHNICFIEMYSDRIEVTA